MRQRQRQPRLSKIYDPRALSKYQPAHINRYIAAELEGLIYELATSESIGRAISQSKSKIITLLHQMLSIFIVVRVMMEAFSVSSHLAYYHHPQSHNHCNQNINQNSNQSLRIPMPIVATTTTTTTKVFRPGDPRQHRPPLWIIMDWFVCFLSACLSVCVCVCVHTCDQRIAFDYFECFFHPVLSHIWTSNKMASSCCATYHSVSNVFRVR